MVTRKNKQEQLSLENLPLDSLRVQRERAENAIDEKPKKMKKATVDSILDAEKAKQIRDEKAATGRAVARRAEEVKRRAFEFEKTNNSKILAFFSGTGWHKIGGTSALIYAHIAAPQIGLKVTLKNDTDFYNKFVTGIISVRHIDILKENLASIGFKVQAEDDDMILFDIGRELSKEELKAIRSVESDRIDRINQIVRTKRLYPNVQAKLREISKKLYSEYLHCTPLQREYFVKEMAIQGLKSTVDLISVCNGEMDDMKGLNLIYQRNQRLKAYCLQLLEQGIFSADNVLSIETELTEANMLIKSEINKLKEEKNNAAVRNGENTATVSVAEGEEGSKEA